MTGGKDLSGLSPEACTRLSRLVMRRQGGLSLRVASVFIVLLLGLPLLNQAAPDLANAQVFGFTVTWLFLGVLIYPITVGLSFYFVKESDRIEAEIAEQHDLRQILKEETSPLASDRPEPLR